MKQTNFYRRLIPPPQKIQAEYVWQLHWLPFTAILSEPLFISTNPITMGILLWCVSLSSTVSYRYRCVPMPSKLPDLTLLRNRTPPADLCVGIPTEEADNTIETLPDFIQLSRFGKNL